MSPTYHEPPNKFTKDLKYVSLEDMKGQISI